MRKKKILENVTVEKMVFGKQGFGHAEGRPVFVWNALPGEVVDVEVFKKNRKRYEGVATVIHKASPERVDPREPGHYLSCSPYQMMTFAEEQRQKVDIARATYERIGGLNVPEDFGIAGDEDAQYEYRNKIEYSFYFDKETEDVDLAFFNRGRHSKQPLTECALARPELNRVAREVLNWIKENKFEARLFKSLVVRSNSAGEVIAGLFVKEDRSFDSVPQFSVQPKGFGMYYSRREHPAACVDGVIAELGELELEEEVSGTRLRYGLQSFFQVNVPVFEHALMDIAEAIPEGSEIVDLYSGVGSISLPLTGRVQSCQMVEIVSEAVEYVKRNIAASGAEGYEVVCAPSEKALEYVTKDKVLIIDPPRAGLHEDVVSRIAEVGPQTIVYLSCDIATHARDVGELTRAGYTIDRMKLYNFFPRTPHIEGLVILRI